MSSQEIGVEYYFHPVGQGLFSSGTLGNFRNGDWMGREAEDVKFEWVYDCGTTSSDEFLDAAIQRFVSRRSGELRKLGLLALSHFDRDHISGVVRLLRETEVDVLLLPYVPLGNRLVLALAAGVDLQDPLMRFFINPVAYLREADIRGIDRIVFVQGNSSSGDEGRDVPVSDQPRQPEQPEEEFRLEFDHQPISDVEPELSVGGSSAVLLLRQGSALRISLLWEFLPHNDFGQSSVPAGTFVADVTSIAEMLRTATGDEEREAALNKLKARYDEQFGSGSKQRNIISLFLYAGPVHVSRWYEGRVNHWGACREVIEFSCWTSVDMVRSSGKGAFCSILYTGDGYLNTKARMTALKRSLGARRFAKIAVCQVMHHGARGNWRPGVAAIIAPVFSVFSSDPSAKKPGHPHAEVLRDFWCYGPVQVSKDSSAQFHFWWIRSPRS